MSTDKSQNNWCNYSLLNPPSVIVRRFDSKGHRFYFWQQAEDGKLVTKTSIGVTSLLSSVMPESQPLTDWKMRTPNWRDILYNSSEYGTLAHLIFPEWALHKNVPREMLDAARIPVLRAGMNPDLPEKDLLAWTLFCEEYEVEVMLVEAMLISPEINGDHYCLALDLLCKLSIPETHIEVIDEGVFKSGPRKGEQKLTEKKTKVKVRKTACLDWKTNFASKEAKSFFPSHKFQLIGAKRAVEYNFPDIKIDLLINWAPSGWRTNPSYDMKIWDITQQDEDMFDAYVNIAHVSGVFKPSGSIFVAPEFTPETKSSDFRVMSYEDYVEQVLLPGQQLTTEEVVTEFLGDDESPILTHLNQYEDIEETAGLLVERPQS